MKIGAVIGLMAAILAVIIIVAVVGFRDNGAANDQLTFPNDLDNGINDEINGDTVRLIEVEGGDFWFSPSNIAVEEGETVEISFTNVGDMPHDFRIRELNIGTSVIGPGETESFTFTVEDAGTYTFFCSVGSHEQQGMVGELEII